MFSTFKNAWKLPELRKKMLFTVLIVIAFRFGSVIPVPFLDMSALTALMSGLGQDTALGYVNMLTGGAFAQATLFALGIGPYINASIIMNLLTVAIPPLEKLAKEGETGRKKIAMITRFATVGLGLIMGGAYFAFLHNSGITEFRDGVGFWISAVTITLTFTAGTALIMWMGEQINEKGVGNGISIILFAGIVAQLPTTAANLWSYFSLAIQDPSTNGKYFVLAPLFVILFLAIIWIIVFMNESERRIPIQYAKKMVGRKMYGGQNSHLPIKVAMSGVMPVIFASAILSLPATIQFFTGIENGEGFWGGFFEALAPGGWIYIGLYLVFIIAFAYFYMSIQYNPIEMANNLKQSNGTIPGIRPGKPTSLFISKILNKVTLIGAGFLAIIALLPLIYGNITGMDSLMMGGTSVIIMVGVALETVKQIESQMMMRHYKGFLD